MKKKYLLLIIIILILNNVIKAQNFDYFGASFIKNYVKTDYDAAAQNWDIAQDSRGIMYFANTFCILEFDGSNWKKYFLPNELGVRTINIDSLDRI